MNFLRKEMRYEEIKIGTKSEFSRLITAKEMAQFRSLTGDINSVHIGKNAIVFGMLTASLISTMIGVHLPGDGAIWTSQSLKFIRPVKIGDTITVKAEVWGKMDSDNTITLLTDIYNQNSELVTAGSALIKVPK